MISRETSQATWQRFSSLDQPQHPLAAGQAVVEHGVGCGEVANEAMPALRPAAQDPGPTRTRNWAAPAEVLGGLSRTETARFSGVAGSWRPSYLSRPRHSGRHSRSLEICRRAARVRRGGAGTYSRGRRDDSTVLLYEVRPRDGTGYSRPSANAHPFQGLRVWESRSCLLCTGTRRKARF